MVPEKQATVGARYKEEHQVSFTPLSSFSKFSKLKTIQASQLSSQALLAFQLQEEKDSTVNTEILERSSLERWGLHPLQLQA